MRLVFGDFAESTVVEDSEGPESVVACGIGGVAASDLVQVIVDAVELAGELSELVGVVASESGVDGGLLVCSGHEYQIIRLWNACKGVLLSVRCVIHEGHEGARREITGFGRDDVSVVRTVIRVILGFL